jgi:hypothetical protein
LVLTETLAGNCKDNRDNKAVDNLTVQFVGKNLKSEGRNAMLMLLFLIIEIVLALTCVIVTMRAVLCSQKRCGLHLFVMWIDVGEVLVLLHDINWVHNLQLEGVNFVLDSKKVVGYFIKAKMML